MSDERRPHHDRCRQPQEDHTECPAPAEVSPLGVALRPAEPIDETPPRLVQPIMSSDLGPTASAAIAFLREQNAALLADRDRLASLLDKLRPYLEHDDECALLCPWMEDECFAPDHRNHTCTCPLSPLLAEIPKREGEEER